MLRRVALPSYDDIDRAMSHHFPEHPLRLVGSPRDGHPFIVYLRSRNDFDCSIGPCWVQRFDVARFEFDAEVVWRTGGRADDGAELAAALREVAADDYMNGSCWFLAQALHQRYGFQIVGVRIASLHSAPGAIDILDHVGVKVGHDRFLDVRGLLTEDEFLSDMADGHPWLEEDVSLEVVQNEAAAATVPELRPLIEMEARVLAELGFADLPFEAPSAMPGP